MRFFSSKFFSGSCVSNKRTRQPQPTVGSGYETLESRRLLASIFLNTASGELFISGGSGDDVGALVALGGQFEASITGAESKTFDAHEIETVSFIGGDGNDTLTNSTNIRSSLFGGNGDDKLTGGRADDFINGGAGADVIVGSSGNDVLVGGLGDDVISGGAGNDRILGTAGQNKLYGRAGDDVIFGGDQADRIFGGSGIDQIYGLDGDDYLYSGDGGVAGTAGIAQADLVLGLGGNDTIVGGNGLNVLWGGDGDDIITGGDSAQNRLHGQAGNDTLTGGDGFDFIRGIEGENIINGGAGGDFIIAGLGDENFDGGAGNDTIRFTGNYSSYRINENTTDVLTVRDLREEFEQGDNDTQNVERFEFADESRAAAISSVAELIVRPIIVSNNNGRDTAVFFGDAEAQAEIEVMIDDIYAQANIDVVFEQAVAYNDTFANTGNTSGTRPISDLRTIVTQGDRDGVGSPNANVVDAYFVDHVPGFRELGEGNANGLAFVGSSGVAIHIGDALVDLQLGLKIIAGVVAHELGHNLGLSHVESASNLLNSGTVVRSNRNNFLTTGQIQQILASPLITDIDADGDAVSNSSDGFAVSGSSYSITDDGTIQHEGLGHDHGGHDHAGHDHANCSHDVGCLCAACTL